MTCTVLFLCTGNFYRSRFAEMLFDHRAAETCLRWQAASRGIATDFLLDTVSPLSPVVISGLLARGIPVNGKHRFPAQVTETDLAGADLIVALDEDEHRPLLRDRYPDWSERVEYWCVHDLDRTEVAQALAEIAQQVELLLCRLREPCGPRCEPSDFA